MSVASDIAAIPRTSVPPVGDPKEKQAYSRTQMNRLDSVVSELEAELRALEEKLAFVVLDDEPKNGDIEPDGKEPATALAASVRAWAGRLEAAVCGIRSLRQRVDL